MVGMLVGAQRGTMETGRVTSPWLQDGSWWCVYESMNRTEDPWKCLAECTTVFWSLIKTHSSGFHLRISNSRMEGSPRIWMSNFLGDTYANLAGPETPRNKNYSHDSLCRMITLESPENLHKEHLVGLKSQLFNFFGGLGLERWLVH